MSDKDKVVRVAIFGEEYSIRGNANGDYMLRVADCVDKKMRDIALRSKNRSPHKIAVLAALNLADELLDLKDNLEANNSITENKARNLLELLDSKLEGSGDK
nr:cell division protein ZapA [candidate division Zixibacteria bacterium]